MRRRVRSVHGLVIVLAFLLASPSIFSLMRDGPFDARTASPLGVLGALAIAHVAFALTFAAMAWVSMATGLVLKFQHAPLRAHPAVLPVALFHEVVGVGIVRNALIVLFFFYGLHWTLLRVVLASPARWGVHALLMVLLFAAIGAFVFSVVRRKVLQAPDPRQRALRANTRGVIGALVVTLVGYGAEGGLGQLAPGALVRIGEIATSGVVALIPPLHAATAVSLLPAVAWLILGAVVAVRLWRAGTRSAPSWVPDLPVDQDVAPISAAARFQSLIFGRGTVRRAATFCAKDLLLPALRNPARHFLRQWFTFAGIASVPILVRLADPDWVAATAPSMFPVLAAVYALVQALVYTLPLLGVEGRRIALLMPMMSARTLLVLKGVPAIAFVTAHTLAGTVLLLAVGVVVGYPGIPVVDTLAVALVGGIVAGALGVAVAFLFPDFERRSPGNPGASVAGRLTFSAVGSFSLGVFSTLILIGQAEVIPREVLGVSQGIVAVLTALGAVLIAYAGTARLTSLEIR